MKKLFLTSVLAVFLIGCAAPPRVDLRDSQTVYSKSELKYDKYKGDKTLDGPIFRDTDWRRFALHHNSKDGLAIVFTHSYQSKNPRYYSEVYDSNQTKLNARINRPEVESCSVNFGCTYFEGGFILTTEQYLKQNAENGIKFQASGRGGNIEFFIPPGYIQGFLQKYKEFK
jgi:opacity protein-like surface antigen